MSNPTVTVHTLVINEARWIWFTLMAVVDYVDEILVWDTGSTDNTPEIVQSINSPKIKFRSLNISGPLEHSQARRDMLQQTRSDWFVIVDGDEIWWKENFSQLISTIYSHPGAAGIISPYINSIGDVYHFQHPSKSSYKIHQYRGPYTIRAINRNLPNLFLNNPHGRQEYQTQGIALQNLPPEQLIFLNKPYLHVTHLPRSTDRSIDNQTLKRNFKYRYELGLTHPRDFLFPEVFYYPRPSLVPSPFFRRTSSYLLKASFLEVPRSIKRIVSPYQGHGY